MEIAHRGYSELYKDNTIQSLKKAIEYNFDMIELDIQLTKDDKIVIYHDTYIMTKNNSFFIFDLTYDEIKSIDDDIPLLDDLFNMINGFNNVRSSQLKIYLDIKGTKKIVQILIDYLHNNKHKYDQSKLYIGSFNILIIESLYNLNTDLNLGIISETIFTLDILQIFLEKYKLKFFCFHWSVLQHDEINFLKNRNVLVFTYTNKFNIILKRMKQFNIDGIVTNYKISNS